MKAQRVSPTGKSDAAVHAPKAFFTCGLLASSAANAAAPIYFDLGGLVLAAFFVAVAVVLGVAYAVGGGKGVGAAIILGGAYLGWWAIQISGDAETQRSLNDWRRSAREACEAEYATLPKVIETTNVVDTTVSLARTGLLQLFSERGLEFVEVKVAEEPFRAKAIFREDCCNSGWVRAGWTQKPYVRLKLGKTSDSTCHPELTAPSWQAAPFLPNTCLLAEEIDQPSAAVRLEELGAKDNEPRGHGWVRVVDAKSEQVLAQLTSSAVAGYGLGDRLSRPGQPPRSSRCLAPHYLLADLLRNPRRAPPRSQTQVLSEVGIQPNTALSEVATRASEWPTLRASGQAVYLSKEEEWNIFNSSIRLEEWTEHIENAKRNADGIAPHGHQLIDLGEATLIRLDSGNEGHLNWWTHAAFNGFFVMKREGVDGKRLLARFTRQGQLEWVVSIAAEDGLSTRRDEPALDFKGAAVEGGDLVLYGRGQLVQPKEKGPADSYAVTAFRIPVERLPPMKDYP